MTLKPAFVAALLALFLPACQPQDGATAGNGGPAGQEATKAADLTKFKTGQFAKLDLDQDVPQPASTFVDGDGKPHTFAEFKGKVLVYNIWAEWCGPCVEEMPTLAALQKAFADKDVVVVPVAAGYPKDRDSAKAKLHELVGADLPFYYDDKFNVNADARTGAFPATIIYDKAGKEVARLEWPAKWNAADAIALVQAVLDGAK